MKLVTIILATLLTQITWADDSFTIQRDGKEYLCRAQGPVDPTDTAACASKAYAGPFSREESIELCSGSTSIAPADCGIKAYSGPFSKAEALTLCKYARSNDPIDCAARAYAGPFSREESLTLCKGNGSLANAECAIKAYAGPYSKAEAIKLCASNPYLVNKALDKMLSSSKTMQLNYFNSFKSDF